MSDYCVHILLLLFIIFSIFEKQNDDCEFYVACDDCKIKKLL